MRSAKGSVRAFILETLKQGKDEKDIFSTLTLVMGLKPGNAKLHIKKAKAQFTVMAMTASYTTTNKSRKVNLNKFTS